MQKRINGGEDTGAKHRELLEAAVYRSAGKRKSILEEVKIKSSSIDFKSSQGICKWFVAFI